MKRRLLWLIALSLFLLVTIGLGLLVATAPGMRWLLSRAAPLAPGRLRIARIDGTLLGPLSLRGIDYTDESGQLTVDQLRLSWRPIHLLRGEFSIDTLSVQGVQYKQPSQQRSPRQGGGGPLPSIRLPLRIEVSKADIDRITYASGDQRVTLDHVAISGRMDERGLKIRSLQVASPLFDLSLSGTIDPRGDYPFSVAIVWSAPLPAAPPLQGEGEVQGTLKQFDLRHRLTKPFRIGTQGTVRLEEGAPRFDLTGAWNKVQWPPAGEAAIESTDGSYRISGRIDDYQFHLQAGLQGRGFPDSLWKMEATGTRASASLKAVEIQTLGGKIDGRGEIAWQPTLRWTLALNGSALNPGERWPDWTGRIGFHLDTRGAWAERGPVGRLQLSELKGRLRGYPVRARVRLKVDQEAYDLEALDVRSGEAALIASGEFRNRWNLRWKIQAPDLAALVPNAGGGLFGSGSVRGPQALPTLSANIRGTAVKWTENRVHQFDLNGLIDLQDKVASHIELNAEGIAAAGQVIARLHMDGKGRLAEHTLQADARSRDQQVSLRMEGGLAGKQWKGAMKKSVLQDKLFGKWTLDQPMPMTLATDAVHLEKGCWLQAPARLCVAGGWQREQGWRTEGRAERLPLGLAKPWLPPDLILSGAVDGEWSASQNGGRLQFKTQWTPQPGMLVYKVAKEEPLGIPFQDGLFQAELNGETLQAKARLTLTGYGALQSALTLAPIGLQADWRQSRLQGTVQARLDRLEPVAAFVPAVTQAGGKIRIDFALAGTPIEPQITGKATLEEGKARISPLGINLDPIRLQIRSGQNGTLLIDAEAHSDPGRVKVNGTIGLDAKQGWPTRLSIRGERFKAVDLPEVRLLASPDLTLQVRGRKVTLDGDVLIPEAQITPRELPKEAIQVSEDAVVVRTPSGEASGAAQGWQISTDVRIRFGDKVAFNGFGLTGKIAGELLTTEAPDQPTLAEGTLRIIDGQYRAYGQKLDITDGRLIFAGPTDNPGLDIRAVRKVEEITAGIHVSGTLKHPQSTLFSDPPMDDANTLSYLLLGHPLHQASGAEGDLLTKAIAALGVKGGNLLAKKVARTLGLDELTLQAGNTPQETTLVIGKYLSPRFYVSYGIGLFESSNTLSLRYKLNQSLTLRAQSGQEDTIDLLYTHEYN